MSWQPLRRLWASVLRARPHRVLAVAVLALGLAAVVRLVVAPLALPGAQWISSQASAALGSSVRIDGVSVQLRGASLRLFGRGFSARSERVSARADDVVIDLGFGGRSITFNGMRIDARAGKTVQVGAKAPGDALAELGAITRQLARRFDRAALRHLTIEDGRLQLITDSADLSTARVFRDLHVKLMADETGFTATADAIAREGRASIAITLQGEEGILSASMNGVTPTDFGTAGPIRSGFPAEASLVSRVNDRGEFVSADITVTLGPGLVRFSDDPIRQLDGAGASFAIDDTDTITMTQARFVAGGTVVEASGTLRPPSNASDAWRFDLSAPSAIFDAPDIDGPPVMVDVLAGGQIDFADGIVHFERLSAKLPVGRVDAVITLILSDDGERAAGAAHISSAPLEQLLKAWPPGFIYAPRKAIRDTVAGGALASADIEFALTPLELDGDPATTDLIEGGLSVDATVRNVTFRSSELPIAALGLDGTVMVRDRQLNATFAGGRFPAGNDESFEITSATLNIPRLRGGAPARLTAVLEGELSAVASLVDELEIEAAEEFDISPDDVTGTIVAEATLTTPLASSVTMDQRSWSIDARLKDAGSSVPIGGQIISDANLEVLLNARRIAARGRATIDGLTIDVNYNELFSGGSSSAARFVVTDAERARRGFDTGRALRGPVTLTVEQGGAQRRTVTADLTRASVDLPMFQKAAGVALNGEGVVKGDFDALDITEIRIDGAGAFFAGNLALRNGALSTATINQLALSQGDRVSGTVRRSGRRYNVSLTAERFDGRDLIEDLLDQSGGNGGGAGPDVALDLNARRVLVANNAVIGNLDVKARHDGRRLASLSASGRIDDTAAGSFAVDLSPTSGGQRTLKADLTELGRALSALGIYERMDGGRTTIDARVAADGVATGRLVATDFVLSNERSLETLIDRTQRALDQDRQNPLPLALRRGNGEDGLPFERLMIDFRKVGDRIVVNEAILRGAVVGGTANGTINLDTNRVDMSGTLIPAYGVNNLFGRLPILGGILGGGDKGGLIGVTFKLVGDIENPTLVVNPISAIAPGIFRRIFEFRQTSN